MKQPRPVREIALGRGKAVLVYPNGEMRFRHECRRERDGLTLVVAPRLQLAEGGHRVVIRKPLTIHPSILCGDCGTHGWVRAGRWHEA